MQAVEKTLEAGGDKHRLQSEVLAITKPYNARRSENNCNEDKVMRMLRKMRKETGLSLPLADATKLNADRMKYWVDRLSKYND